VPSPPTKRLTSETKNPGCDKPKMSRQGQLRISLALHYVLTVILAFGGKEEATKSLNSIFNAWLPAISSLVSAAATYYFTRDKQ